MKKQFARRDSNLDVDQVRQEPMFLFLMVLTIASTAGLQTWRTLFNNFAVEVALLEGDQIGFIQSFREIPGFLALLIIYMLLVMREHRLSAFSIVALGAGVMLTGLFPSYFGLLFTTLLMSFGFHYYETTNQSLTLQYFDQNTSPWVLGKLRSISAAANILVGLLILVLASYLDYIQLYLLLGSAIVGTGIWALFRDPSRVSLPPQKKKLVLKKKYGLYYFLTFMSGTRRQIFVVFAVFLLVRNFQFTVQEITLLFVVNNVINFFLYPLIGKAIITIGERKVLSIEYASLIVVFIAYTLADSKLLVAVLYVLDHMVFGFSLAIKTYFQKIADPSDIAPSMAVGFTINHIAAVVIPALGGILWMYDFRLLFWGGALLSLISLIATQFIRSGLNAEQSR